MRAAAAPKANGQPHSGLEDGKNRRLHLALLGALAAAALIALAVPITRTRASTEPGATPGAAASEGILQTVRSQAGSLALAALPHSDQADLTGTSGSLSAEALIPPSLLTAVVELATGRALPSGEGAGWMVAPARSKVSFTLHEEGFPMKGTSSGATVGEALLELGVELSPHDRVRPALDTPLSNGMHVFITHARPIRLIAGARESLIYTQAETVRGLMMELGLDVQPSDHIFPALDDPIKRGMTVSLVTFRDGIEFTEEPLAYETEFEYDSSVLQGERRLVQAGVDGYVRRQYQLKQLNGQELDRVLVDETWVWPTNEIIVIGTRVPATPTPVPRPVVRQPAVSFEGLSCVGSLYVYATYYTAASAGGSGTTATGTAVYKGIVAVDPRVIPLGTRMYIPGYGYGLAADTGGAIQGNIIDLGYGSSDVMDWRPRYLDICILG